MADNSLQKTAKTANRARAGPLQKGQSGNPAGGSRGSVKQSNSLSPAKRRCGFVSIAALLHAASGRSRCAAADQHTVDLLGALKAVGSAIERRYGKDNKARASFTALGYNFLRSAGGWNS